MASASLTGVYLHGSVVRGRHIYKRVWSPIIGEVLELLREEESEHDRFAVCLLKPGAVTVGHVPHELSCKIWYFLIHGWVAGASACALSISISSSLTDTSAILTRVTSAFAN